MRNISIFCDGACSGNPGPGGYGIVIKDLDKNITKEISGGEAYTTNNKMELIAAITGLEALKIPCKVTVTTDSQYLVKGMNEWVKGWSENNWRNSKKELVANVPLWKRLIDLSTIHEIRWEWVRGHVGHPENERCDELAKEAINNL